MEPDQPQLQQNTPVNGVVNVLLSAALATFALFLVDVGADLLPPQPLDPLWLLSAATAFVNALTIPLVGVLFLHLVAALAPLTDLGQICRSWASRVATLLALTYLLLLPLLGFATWRGITNIQASVKQRVELININSDRVRAAIRKASTPNELQQFMVEQQGPPVNAQELNTPLAALKQSKLLMTDQFQAYYIRQIPGLKDKSYEPIFINTLRTTALAFVASAGFASLAWYPKRQQSLLKVLFEIRTRTNARIVNKLNTLRPVPDQEAKNSRLMQKSRDTQRKNMLRNQREMEKSELQRRKILSKIQQEREKNKKKELEMKKNQEDERID